MPEMKFSVEHVPEAIDIWRVIDHATDEEKLRTSIPVLDQIELCPEDSSDLSRAGKTGTQSWRPPWMAQYFLPRLVPFCADGVRSRLLPTRTFLEPKAYEATKRLEYPWSTVGYIRGEKFGHPFRGSGTLVGSNLVLTAGHVVPWGDPDGWMEFIPAYSKPATNAIPYGSSYVKSFKGYPPSTPFTATGYDLAVCELYKPLGDALGWMGVEWYPDESDYLGRQYNSSGYPVAFAGRPAVEFGLKIVDIDSDSPGIELETDLYLDSNVYGGWSGGPLWYYDGTDPMIVGTVCGHEKDVFDPERVVHSGGKALFDLV
jgi:V8-like Glu-specific endopeptidase